MNIDTQIIGAVLGSLIVGGLTAIGWFLKSLKDDIKEIGTKLSIHISAEDKRLDANEKKLVSLELLTKQHEKLKPEHSAKIEEMNNEIIKLKTNLEFIKDTMAHQSRILDDINKNILNNAIGNDLLQNILEKLNGK